MAGSFQLITSVRYDPALKDISQIGSDRAGWNHRHVSPFYMLDYHRDRMLKAATHWGWKPATDVLDGDEALQVLAETAEEFIGSLQTTPVRLKIILNRMGEVQFERYNTNETSLENLFPKRLPPPGAEVAQGDPSKATYYNILVDPAVSSKSEHTYFKTTQRQVYDAARKRAEVSPADHKEVLVVNENDEVMECTLTTPYFWRGNRWVTPPVPCVFSHSEGSGGQDGVTRRWALEQGLASEEVVLASSLTDGEECWISNGARGFISGVVSLS